MADKMDEYCGLIFICRLFPNLFLIQELITRIISLETHNQQLKNIIKKETYKPNDAPHNDKQRKFNFST